MNQLNFLWKCDKMLGKPHIWYLSLSIFNKFNNTWPQMQDPLCTHVGFSLTAVLKQPGSNELKQPGSNELKQPGSKLM